MRLPLGAADTISRYAVSDGKPRETIEHPGSRPRVAAAYIACRAPLQCPSWLRWQLEIVATRDRRSVYEGAGVQLPRFALHLPLTQ